MVDAVRFNEQDLAAVDAAVTQLEKVLGKLVALEPQERKRLFKMGNKNEKFCREAMNVLDKNRQLVPPALDLNGALAALATLDGLRPRTAQILRLAERLQDTQLLLGSNVATAARLGYRALQQYGDAHGLEGMRQALGARFKRRSPSNKTGRAGGEVKAA